MNSQTCSTLAVEVFCDSFLHFCRQPSQPGFQLECRGGMMAAEAVALLKEFYATGNPKGVLLPQLQHS